MADAHAKRGHLWRTAASLAGVAILISVMSVVHAFATGWARDILAHHAGDPLGVQLALIGSALLLLAGPVILLAGLYAIGRSLVAGAVLLLGGGFLSVGLLHFYPMHVVGLNDTIWGFAAEAFSLLLPVAVVVLGFVDAWRVRRAKGG